MGECLPNILQIIYATDKERYKDETTEQSVVLKEFEQKKYDGKYHLMLEKSNKLNKKKGRKNMGLGNGDGDEN